MSDQPAVGQPPPPSMGKTIAPDPTSAETPSDQGSFVYWWGVASALRQEILEAQKIRTQIIGLKITSVGTGIAVLLAQGKSASLLIIPALAAVFFDLLINSHSVQIKRVGYYTRTVIDPALRSTGALTANDQSWEEFMSAPWVKQSYSLVANLGLTLLAAVPALLALFSPFRWFSVPLTVILVGLFSYDVWAFIAPRRIAEGRAWKAEGLPAPVSLRKVS